MKTEIGKHWAAQEKFKTKTVWEHREAIVNHLENYKLENIGKFKNSSVSKKKISKEKELLNLNKSFNPDLLEKSSGVRPIKPGSYFKVDE